MIKTNISPKKSSPKKTPTTKVLAEKKTPTQPKAAPKKLASKSSPVSKTSPAIEEKIIAKKIPAKKAVVKETTLKSAPAKKSTSKTVTAKIVEKISASPLLKESSNSSEIENIKMLGILHLAANLLSGGMLGIILVALYYFVKKDSLSALEKETVFEIINFNLSFIIYAFIAFSLVFVLIGFILVPAVFIAWLVLMVLGFLEHIAGKNYKYPLIIRFIS